MNRFLMSQNISSEGIIANNDKLTGTCQHVGQAGLPANKYSKKESSPILQSTIRLSYQP
jgi:hypothetical protein